MPTKVVTDEDGRRRVVPMTTEEIDAAQVWPKATPPAEPRPAPAKKKTSRKGKKK